MSVIQKLDALLAECEKASPGPWHGDPASGFLVCHFGNSNEDGQDYALYGNGYLQRDGHCGDAKDDFEFTKSARTGYPAALRALKVATQALLALEQMGNDYSEVKAKTALAAIEKELGNEPRLRSI